MYLHIGLPKTGTTAIQENLFLNRELLKKNGILYPSFVWSQEKDWTHNLDVFAHHPIPLNLKKPIISQIQEELIFQIEESDCQKVIISSESFVFAADPLETRSFFNEIFQKISLILYLRDPLEFIISDYFQGVKGHRRLYDTFEKYLNEKLKFSKSLNYDSLISKWKGPFDNDMVIKCYTKEIDLVADFIGIFTDYDELNNWSFPVRKDSNPRLRIEDLEEIRKLNFLGAPFEKICEFVEAIKVEGESNRKNLHFPHITNKTKKKLKKWVEYNRNEINRHVEMKCIYYPFDSLTFNIPQIHYE